jgi:hypothetical protein
MPLQAAPSVPSPPGVKGLPLPVYQARAWAILSRTVRSLVEGRLVRISITSNEGRSSVWVGGSPSNVSRCVRLRSSHNVTSASSRILKTTTMKLTCESSRTADQDRSQRKWASQRPCKSALEGRSVSAGASTPRPAPYRGCRLAGRVERFWKGHRPRACLARHELWIPPQDGSRGFRARS